MIFYVHTLFPNRETILCPSPSPGPYNCKYSVVLQVKHIFCLCFNEIVYFCYSVSDKERCADTPLLVKNFPQQSQHECYFILLLSSSFHLFKAFSLKFCSPSFMSFLIRVSVSFDSISKCPTQPVLLDTILTAIWPTTTTDWEGAKAATVG